MVLVGQYRWSQRIRISRIAVDACRAPVGEHGERYCGELLTGICNCFVGISHQQCFIEMILDTRSPRSLPVLVRAGSKVPCLHTATMWKRKRARMRNKNETRSEPKTETVSLQWKQFSLVNVSIWDWKSIYFVYFSRLILILNSCPRPATRIFKQNL